MTLKPTINPATDPRVVGGAIAYAGTLCALGTRRPMPPRR